MDDMKKLLFIIEIANNKIKKAALDDEKWKEYHNEARTIFFGFDPLNPLEDKKKE